MSSRAQFRVRDTEEQRQRRREADRERKRQKRAATRDAYRAANRLRMAAGRTVEPPEDTSARREAARTRAAERRSSESLEVTAARREIERGRAAERRSNESLEETAARRESDRGRAVIRRAEAQRQRSASARHDVLDQLRLGRLAANRDKFRHSLLLGPLSICYSCSRYTYPSGGSYVGCDSALFQPLHNSDSSHILPESEESVWVCTRCRTSLKKGKIPSFSVVNNIHVAPVPTELSCLNITEKRLICRVQAFMKLIVLPHGQRAMQGQAINFPVNTSELCSTLPRPVDRSGIILIAPPQSGSSDSTEVQRPSQYYAVRRPYVFRAIRWLKAHNQLYRDVEIDDDSLNEPDPEPHQPQQESEEGSPELKHRS